MEPDRAPTAYLIAIGSIAVSCGHIEANVRDIAQALIDDQGDIGKALMTNANLAAAEQAVKLLLPIRLPEDIELQKRITAAVSRSRSVMSDRNRVLHSRWMISGSAATVLLKNDSVTDWPIEQLEQIASEAYDAAVELSRAWFDLLYAWGHFDELAEATQRLIEEETDESSGSTD